MATLLVMATGDSHLASYERDRQLLYIVAFVVFFPFSAIYLIARWLVRRQKDQTRGSW